MNYMFQIRHFNTSVIWACTANTSFLETLEANQKKQGTEGHTHSQLGQARPGGKTKQMDDTDLQEEITAVNMNLDGALKDEADATWLDEVQESHHALGQWHVRRHQVQLEELCSQGRASL